MSSDFAARHPRIAEIFGIDLRSLALFRFLLGSLLFWLLCGSLCQLGALYTDAGVLPRGWVMASESPWRLSLYFLNGTATFAGALLLLQIALAAMLALGWHSRCASILGFVLYASLVSRAPLAAGSVDQLLVALLFWSSFLPLGARWSVDAALASNPPPHEDRHVSWAGAGLLLQLVSVHFFNALLRSAPEWHEQATALYYLLSLDGHATALGQWLLGHPALLRALTVALWWLPLLAPLMLLPWLSRYARMVLLPLLAALQILLLLILDEGLLPLLNLAALALLIGERFWQRNGRGQPVASTLRIYYDRDCPACRRVCLLLQQFLVLPRAQLAAAQDAPRARTLLEANRSWVVIDTDDQAHLKWDALAVLVKHSPLFGGLHRLVGTAALRRGGNRVHDAISLRRQGAFDAPPAAAREVRWQIGDSWQRLAAVFIALLLAWNLAGSGLLPAATQRLLAPLMQGLRLDQSWSMDAPAPPKDDGWFVAAGRMADGREIDLLHPAAGAPDYGKPAAGQTDDGIRWRRLRERLASDAYAAHRPYYARWLCERWNAGEQPRLASLKLIHVLESTPPPGGTLHSEQRVLLQHECAP